MRWHSRHMSPERHPKRYPKINFYFGCRGSRQKTSTYKRTLINDSLDCGVLTTIRTICLISATHHCGRIELTLELLIHGHVHHLVSRQNRDIFCYIFVPYLILSDLSWTIGSCGGTTDPNHTTDSAKNTDRHDAVTPNLSVIHFKNICIFVQAEVWLSDQLLNFSSMTPVKKRNVVCDTSKHFETAQVYGGFVLLWFEQSDCILLLLKERVAFDLVWRNWNTHHISTIESILLNITRPLFYNPQFSHRGHALKTRCKKETILSLPM